MAEEASGTEEQQRPIFGNLTLSIGVLAVAAWAGMMYLVSALGVAELFVAWVVVFSWLYAVLGPRAITEYRSERIELPAQVRCGMGVFFVASAAAGSIFLPEKISNRIGGGLLLGLVSAYVFLAILGREELVTGMRGRRSRWAGPSPKWWRPFYLAAFTAVIAGACFFCSAPALFSPEGPEYSWSIGLLTFLAYVHVFQLALGTELGVVGMGDSTARRETTGLSKARRWLLSGLLSSLVVVGVLVCASSGELGQTVSVLLTLALGEASLLLSLTRVGLSRQLVEAIWPAVGSLVALFLLANLLGLAAFFADRVRIAPIFVLYFGMAHFFLRELVYKLSGPSAA